MWPAFWQRFCQGERRFRQQPYWNDFAPRDWADRIMALELGDRFHAKQGRSIVRWTLEAAGQQRVVYLKRHYRLPWWQRWRALFRPGTACSPAMHEWEHLEWAGRQGLPVPRAAAAGEFIGPGPRLQSFLAVEELTGMLPLHEAVPLAASCLTAEAFYRWKCGLIDEMAAITWGFHCRHYFHKDLYLCHFYIEKKDLTQVPVNWNRRVWLIDLHRLTHHPLTRLWWQAKDLAQLLHSSDLPGITARDRLHFWRTYRRTARLGWMSSWLQAIVQLRSQNYGRRRRSVSGRSRP
jgi:heptose I phosphotransferase